MSIDRIMEYEIVVHRLARVDVLQVYKRSAVNAPVTADKWLARLQRKILTLKSNPQRCSCAAEDPKVAVPLFEVLFGRAPNVFRVIFTIDGQKVRLLRILRAQRRPLSRQQVIDALDE